MSLAWAFFKRDAMIATSYRVAFLMQFVGMFLLLSVFFYIGKTIGPESLPALEPYGGNFMAFVLIGIALTDCVVVSLISFGHQIREAQTTGTLEATLMSPVNLGLILVYSSLFNYFLSAVRFLFYLVVGIMLFGVNLGHVHVPSAIIIFLLTVLCFMGVGILWAGIVLIIKRGESLMTVAGYVVLLLAGVLFPVEMLPPWAQNLSPVIPLTHALEGMRLALLTDTTLRDLLPILATLSGFAVVLMVLGLGGFNLAVRFAKRTGDLTQY